MAEHEAQAVAEGDGDADFDATDAEAAGGVEQSTEQAAADKAPAAQTLADVIGNEEAEDALISALEKGEYPQADEDSTDDSGQHTEESESTETDEDTDDDDAEETVQQDAKAPVAKEPKRIKVESPMVRRLNDLIRGGMSEADALTFLSKGKADPGKADEGKEQEAQQTTEQKDPVEEKQAELGRLQDELEAASEILDAKETARLLREITKAQGELTDLKMDARERKMQAEQQAKQGQADYEAKEKAALDEVGAMVPEFLTEGTPLRNAADAIAQTLPDQFFAKPDWPKRLLNLAWLEQHPGAPLPGAKANGSNGGVRPLKNGTKAAALTTASGGQSGGSAMSRLLNVAKTGEGSDEELDAVFEMLG